MRRELEIEEEKRSEMVEVEEAGRILGYMVEAILSFVQGEKIATNE